MRGRRLEGRRLRRDEGTVTAELALGLVAVVLVLAVLLLTASAASTRMRCIDAARAGARVAALGESDAEVVAVARRVLPGATVDVTRDPPWVQVEVSRSLTGGWFTGGPVTVTGAATAWAEP